MILATRAFLQSSLLLGQYICLNQVYEITISQSSPTLFLLLLLLF